MENIAEVLQAIFIGTVVAKFLLITNRVVKAIELCKECLILVKNLKIPNNEKDCVRLVIYTTMSMGYTLISDHTNGIECIRKLLTLLCECGDRVTEARTTMHLAILYERQSNYKKAKEIYEKALMIWTEIGERQEQGSCYEHMGTLCMSLGDYVLAKEHLQ